MSPELADALQWLKDCGGIMAYANNPLASHLVKAGLAKKGGYDKLGRRTLVLIGGLDPAPSREKISHRTRSFFQNRPRGKTEMFVTDRIREVYEAARILGSNGGIQVESKPATALSYRMAIQHGIQSLGTDGGFVIISGQNIGDFDQHFGTTRSHNFEPESSETYRTAGIHGVLNDDWTVLVSRSRPNTNYHLWFYDLNVTKGKHLRLV